MVFRTHSPARQMVLQIDLHTARSIHREVIHRSCRTRRYTECPSKAVVIGAEGAALAKSCLDSLPSLLHSRHDLRNIVGFHTRKNLAAAQTLDRDFPLVVALTYHSAFNISLLKFLSHDSICLLVNKELSLKEVGRQRISAELVTRFYHDKKGPHRQFAARGPF